MRIALSLIQFATSTAVLTFSTSVTGTPKVVETVCFDALSWPKFFGIGSKVNAATRGCGLSLNDAPTFNLDTAMMPAIFAGSYFMPPEVNPCDMRTFLNASAISGKVGVSPHTFQFWFCWRFGGKGFDLFGPIFPQASYPTTPLSEQMRWLQNQGVLAAVFNENGWYNAYWTNPVLSADPAFSGGDITMPIALMFDTTFVGDTWPLILMGAPVTVSGDDTLSITSLFPSCAAATSVGVGLVYYLIAFPWLVVIFVSSCVIMVRRRKSLDALVIGALLFEGVISVFLRILVVATNVPRSMSTNEHKYTNFIRYVADIISSCASTLTAGVLLKLVSRRASKLPPVVYKIFFFVLVLVCFVVNYYFLSLYLGMFDTVALADFGTVAVAYERNSAQICAYSMLVTVVVFALILLAAVWQIVNAAKTKQGEGSKKMIRLAALLVAQMLGSTVVIIGIFSTLNLPTAADYPPGVGADSSWSTPSEPFLADIAAIQDLGCSKVFTSDILTIFGGIVASTAQVACLSSSSSSS